MSLIPETILHPARQILEKLQQEKKEMLRKKCENLKNAILGSSHLFPIPQFSLCMENTNKL